MKRQPMCLLLYPYCPRREAYDGRHLGWCIWRPYLEVFKGTSDDVKKAVRALKKEIKYAYKWCEGLFLYNKDEQVAFLRRGESPCIEAYSYDDTQVPLCKYIVPNEVDYIWQHTSYAQRFAYFFNNVDAFFAWDDYIFLSVYEGKLAWTAADSRDTYYLPNRKLMRLSIGQGHRN